jgi:hypothetical protein
VTLTMLLLSSCVIAKRDGFGPPKSEVRI